MTGGAKLLRRGPYDNRRVICFKCHSQEKFLEIDPHVMLDKEGKVLTVNGKPIYLLCHAVQPDPDKDRTDDVRFRADVPFSAGAVTLLWHPPVFSRAFSGKTVAIDARVHRKKRAGDASYHSACSEGAHHLLDVP